MLACCQVRAQAQAYGGMGVYTCLSAARTRTCPDIMHTRFAPTRQDDSALNLLLIIHL